MLWPDPGVWNLRTPATASRSSPPPVTRAGQTGLQQVLSPGHLPGKASSYAIPTSQPRQVNSPPCTSGESPPRESSTHPLPGPWLP